MTHGDTKIVLDPKKIKILETALELGFDATIVKICQKANVPRKTFYNWLGADPEFKSAWDNLWKIELKSEFGGSAKALIKKAHSGDVSAIKLHAQLIGEYTEKKEVEFPNGVDVFTHGEEMSPEERRARIDELNRKRGS
jgi:hypothetical protein